MKYKLITLFSIFFAASAYAEDSTPMYAQHSFYAEKGVHVTTNYAAGACYPVNHEFVLDKINRRIFGKANKMKVTNAENPNDIIEIQNVIKHTKKSMEDIRDRMFGPQKVELSKYSPAVRQAINNCHVIISMTREEVLLARGYPPAHANPSLDADDWTYWRKHFSKSVIHFQNGRVTSMRG
jgi:hypothetical protein